MNDYLIWGIDESPYGPVPLPVLAEWIKDERVLPDTWIFARHEGVWQKASNLSELRVIFNPGAEPVESAPESPRIKPGALRRIKILAEMSDAQLAQLADFLEYQEIVHHTEVIKQGDMGGSMYLILKGEFRARTMIEYKETVFATFGPGDFFGEMCLFNPGPRSADVVANEDSSVLRLSPGAYERMTREMPGLATPFLQASSRTLSARIRSNNKRLTGVIQLFSMGGESDTQLQYRRPSQDL